VKKLVIQAPYDLCCYFCKTVKYGLCLQTEGWLEMTVTRALSEVLLREGTRRPFSGRVLQLGRQGIYMTLDMVKAAAAKNGVRLTPIDKIDLSWDPELVKKNYISDKCFFKMLGFEECESLDNSDFEGADHVFDLNNPMVPDHLRDRFDFIHNGGTMEHVYHVPNVMNAIFSMLKVGGRILHIAPSSNHVDHGFYMFSPTFFTDFYAANKFEINLAQIAYYTERDGTDVWMASNYKPGSLDRISYGGLDDEKYAILFIATKTNESTTDAVPQQGFYSRIHGAETLPLNLNVATTAPDPNILTQDPSRKWLRAAKTVLKGMPGFKVINGLRLKIMPPPSPMIASSSSPKKGLGLPVDAEY
jgi:Methyltransferase domain